MSDLGGPGARVLGAHPSTIGRLASALLVVAPASRLCPIALQPRAPGDAPSAGHQTRSVLAWRARRAAAPRSETRADPRLACDRAVPLVFALRRSAPERSPAAAPQSDAG